MKDRKGAIRRPVWASAAASSSLNALAVAAGFGLVATIASGAIVWYAATSDDRVLVGAGTLGVIAGSLVLLVVVPYLQVPKSLNLDAKDRIELRSKARTTLTQVVAGVALIVGIYGATESWRMSKNAEFTDRLIRCVQLLGAERQDGRKQIDSRVGGIYSLQRIVGHSIHDEHVAMEILAAYVQTNAPVSDSLDDPDADIQAAINVLVKRNRSSDPPGGWLDLSRVRLARVDFTAGAAVDPTQSNTVTQLGRIRFVGSSLRQAFLQSVDLSDVVLHSACLNGAFLARARLDRADLTSADFTGADLRGASFTDAILDATNFATADLTDAEITQEQINNSIGNLLTLLPDDISAPASWSGR